MELSKMSPIDVVGVATEIVVVVAFVIIGYKWKKRYEKSKKP